MEQHQFYIAGILRPIKHLGIQLIPYICQQNDIAYDLAFEKLTVANPEKTNVELDLFHQIKAYAASVEPLELVKRFSKNPKGVDAFFSDRNTKIFDKIVKPYIDKQNNLLFNLFREHDLAVYADSNWPHLYPDDKVCFAQNEAIVNLKFKRGEEETVYAFEAFMDDLPIDLQNNKNKLLSNAPCLLLTKNTIIRFDHSIDGKMLLPFLKNKSIHIPKRIEKTYFEKFIRKVVQKANIDAEGFQVIDQTVTPISRLQLDQSFDGSYGLVLYFQYSDRQFLADDTRDVFTSLTTNEEGFVFHRLQRDRMFEHQMMQLLIENGFEKVGSRFLFSGKFTFNTFLYKLIALRPDLEQLGFQIVQDHVKPYVLAAPAVIFRHKQSTDWFELDITIKVGDFEFPFIALKNHLLQGIPHYELPDGQLFAIPASWFEQYDELLFHGKTFGNKLVFKKEFLGLLQSFNIREAIELEHSILQGKTHEPPGLEAISLRAYQLVGYFWMKQLSEHGLGGLLADDMGLGKTIQIIALLSSYYHAKQIDTIDHQPKNASGGQLDLFAPVPNDDVPTTAIHAPSLLVVPTSLIHNWIIELQRATPWLKYCNYTGPERARFNHQLEGYQLIITTYGTLRNDVSILNKLSYAFAILDEGQQIKNPASKTSLAVQEITASNRFILSGTPIENHLSDLWSLMHFLNPGLLGTRSNFHHRYANPIMKKADHPVKAKLATLLKPFILRRSKQQVLKELPPVTETVVYCEMDALQKEMYESEKSKVRNALLDQIENDPHQKRNAVMVLKALMKLRQLANHPALIEPDYKGSSGKFDSIIETIETIIEEQHKVLVFSSFVGHLNLLASYFSANQIPYAMLTGATTNREAEINRFKKKSGPSVFLISLKAGGVGLNLAEASYVLLIDPWWNPAAELQAIGRSHRIGQKSKVFVYRFITMHTLEEKIKKLQEKKLGLPENLIEEEQYLSQMSLEALIEFIN